MLAALALATAVSSGLAAPPNSDSVTADPSVPPLIEAHRTSFETPYAPTSGQGPKIVALSRSRVAYAISGQDLLVLDTATGSVLDVLDLRPIGRGQGYSNDFSLSFSDDGGVARLVVWRYDAKALRCYDISDPAHPVVALDVALSEPIVTALVVPGGRYAVARLGRVVLIDLDTGSELRLFAPRSDPYGSWDRIAVGGTRERPLIAVSDHRSFSGGTTRYAVSVYEVSDTDVLRDVVWFDPGWSASFLLDRTGSIIVLEGYAGGYPDIRARYEIRDLPAGAVASVVEPPGGGTVAAIAEGDGRRALVVQDASGIDVVDLADPAAPRVVGRVEGRMSTPSVSYEYAGGIATSATEPLAFAGALGDREVLAIDVRTATVAGRFPTGPTPPVGASLREGGGTRDLVVPAARMLGWRDVLVPGGTHEILFADATNAADMTASGRLVRNQPRRVDGLGILRGSLGVALDFEENSIALFRLKDGAVLDVTGFTVRVHEGDTSGFAKVLVQDPFVLVWGESGFETFRVTGDRLERVIASHPERGGYFRAALRPDGTVVTLGYDSNEGWFATRTPDGRGARLPFYEWYPTLTLSPDGNLAFVGVPSWYSSEGWARMIDVSDPLAPAPLWEGLHGWAAGAFDLSGERLFGMTNRDEYYFSAAMYAARSGEALGTSGDPVPKWYYHDVGTVFGHGDGARAVVWKWTWAGWETALFDISGPTPALISVLPEFFSFPEYAAREDEGWYELHSGWVGTNFYIGDADGRQAFALAVRGAYHTLPTAVRRGFFATVGVPSPDRRFVSLWRDTALNRAPVARSGGDREVECADRAATRVTLDGRASSDPDSTPGTNDDIASYAWSVDGGAPVEGATAEVALPVGEHAASLAVSDVLGAAATDDARVTVSDTLPPSVELTLEPRLSGGTWGNLYAPKGAVRDLCDGDLGAPAETLRLLPGAADAPASPARGAAPAIELRREPDGSLAVALVGSDVAVPREAWQAAVAAGGFALADGAPVALVLAPEPGGKESGLLARYDLDESGGLARATAFGAAGDHVVDAIGTDRSGHAAAASVSLRATIAELCAREPSSFVCAEAR